MPCPKGPLLITAWFGRGTGGGGGGQVCFFPIILERVCPDLRPLPGGRLAGTLLYEVTLQAPFLLARGTVATGLCSPAAMGQGWAAPGLPSLFLLLLCCGHPMLVPSQEATHQVTTNQGTTSQATTSSQTTTRQTTTSSQTTQNPSGTGWGAGRGLGGPVRRERQGQWQAWAHPQQRARGGLSVCLYSVLQAW